MLRDHYEYQLTGSWDNQLVAVKLDEDVDLPNKIRQIKEDLAQPFTDIGQELKVEESWHSKELLAYQRRYQYKGVPCPVGIKTANRAFASGSDVNSRLHNMISTAMNGGVSLNQYTSESLIGPIFAYTEALVNLGCHPSWSRAHKLGEGIYHTSR